ncbi:V-type ATPase subunit [Calidithermus chliarophilus]|uniref:V-type ATPase subunit n=1 Tax=Calidithermus chliarophilus TaxID=52023 RepID=UPI000423102F|nr:V-type ATPase subunit [Calidithermus chliarophilus]
MAAGYAYLNARVRSRRSQLVGEGFFQQALSASFSDFVRLLGETVYGPDLKGSSLGDVDRAVSGHFGRTVGDLPGLVTGELREVVSLPLLRADLVNLKAILRGKMTGKSAEEIKATLVGGTLPETLVNSMLQASDAASVAQILQLPGNPLARALRNAVQGSPDLLALEVALDREFFAAALAKAKKLRERFLASYFALEVDATNLATAFKLQALGAPANLEAYFIPGGTHLSMTAFSRIAQGDFAAMDTLNATPLAPAASARTLGDLERALRKILREKAHQGSLDSLGPGLALDYIRTKEWEAARIRLLARRAYYNLPADAVEKEVMA